MSKLTNFPKKKSYQQITTGLLSASAFLIGTSSYAATINTQYINSANHMILLTDGDTIQADSAPPSSGYFAGIYGGSSSNNLIVSLGTGSTILSDSAADTTNAAIGIYVRGPNTQITADQLTINVSGDRANGLSIQSAGSSANLGSNSNITVNTTGSGASMASAINLRTASLTAEQLTIDTKGSNTVGVYATNGFDINLGRNSSITTEGQNSTGVRLFGSANTGTFNADALTIETKAADAIAFQIFNGDNITANIGANSHITTEDSDGVSINGNNTFNFKGTDTQRNRITASNIGVVSDNGAIVNLEYTDITASAAMSAYAGTIVGTGQMNITGGIFATNLGLIDLTMDAGSKLTGVALADTGSNGQINLELNNSSWDMSDNSGLGSNNSNVTNLTLNNSIVTFNNAQVGTMLTTQNLSGSGTFNMHTDIANGVSDQLIVKGISAGNHHVSAQNQGDKASTGTEVINMVQTADGGATFDMPNELEVGGYRYGLRQNGNNWDLYSTGKSSSAETSANFLNVSYLLNYAETQTLLQRMGELRQTENSNGDVWVRAFTGKFDSFDGAKLSGFDMDYNGVQIGADKRLSVAAGDLYLGAMGGTSKADSNYKDGSGDVTGYHFGLYGSYVAENDFYVDTVLKYSHLKNSFNVADTQYQRIDGSATSDGYGLSVEVGKRFYFDSAKSGYYLEPQAQLSYSHQGSASTNVSNGLRVDLDSYDSTLGRVSAVAGYEVKNSQTPMNVYFKTGYVTEMSGNTGYSLNGSKESHDFGDDWWENSIGITAQLKKAHNLYLEGTYSSGNKFDQMQLNAGYRYSF